MISIRCKVPPTFNFLSSSRLVRSHHRFAYTLTQAKMSASAGADEQNTVDRRYPWRIPIAERIKTLQDTYGLTKWGFVIYRCDYQNDGAWSRLLEALGEARDSFVEDAEVAQQLDWSIQEDPSLAGATHDEVRRRFKMWVANEGKQEYNLTAEQESRMLSRTPRYSFCIYVGAENLKALDKLSDDDPSDDEDEPTVDLIRADESWDYPDFDRFDWSTYETPEDEDANFDENEEEIEGSRLYDVGWTRVEVDELIPECYLPLVQTSAWANLYNRPDDNQ